MGGSESKSSQAASSRNNYTYSQSAEEGITWIKRSTKWKANVPGKITPDVIQSIIADIGSTLNDDEIKLFIKARNELTKEWDRFLKNATVKIFTDRRTYVITSGDGTNTLTVQRVEDETIQADWTGGIFRPIRNGIGRVGSLMVSVVPLIGSLVSGVGKLAIGYR